MDRKLFKSKVLSLKGQHGNMFFDYFGYETEWCAMFVSYCLKGLAGINWFPKSASCGEIKRTLSERVNRSFKTAEIGDLILFELNNNPSDGAEHIGIVIDNSDGVITTIEGNTKGDNYKETTVNTFEYPVNSPLLLNVIDMSSEFEGPSSYIGFSNEFDKYKNIIDEIKKLVSNV